MNKKGKKNISWKFAIGTGLFVSAFLLIFRPFGLALSGWQDPRFWLIAGLAPYNMALIVVLDVLINRLKERFTVLSDWNVALLVSLVIIVAGNVGYQTVIQQQVDWRDMVQLTWHVALIAVFPALFIILYERNRRTQTPPVSVQIIDPSERITLHDEARRESITVSLEELLFIASDRNYALIHTKNEASPRILRTSLKALEDQLEGTPILRCHRSYLVNTGQITHRRKKARGVALTLAGHKQTIPVSSGYVASIEGVLHD